MSDQLPSVPFTLADIFRAAQMLLAARPSAIIVHRLFREVLRLPSEASELIAAKQAALADHWVRQLETAQLSDGSWGRFHTQDTRLKTVFRTTEEAIDRASALGLEPESNVLMAARRYIERVLLGQARITDWYEKNDAFPILIRHILAGRLAQLDPNNALLDPFWAYLEKLARTAFRSGGYLAEDEEAGYFELSGVRVRAGFMASQYSLYILASRRLDAGLNQRLIDWIWNKPDGIFYLGAYLPMPNTVNLGYWLRSMSIFTRFHLWREQAAGTLSLLWDQRDQDGLWDFGPRISRSIDFPLSESWRPFGNRRTDYSTCLLILLRKYFD